MRIEDEPEIGLTKWPFYLGDALLVATALAIAILGDWQLSDWQVVSCVLAVALGAGLFVLPYIVEFHVLAQENSDGGAAELKILHRQVQQAEDAVERAAVRIHQLEETLAAQVQSAEVVSEVMDGKFKKLEAALAQSAGELSALAQGLEALSGAPTQSWDEPLQAVRQQLAEVQAQLQQRANASALEQLSQRLDRLQQAVASAAKTAASAPAVAAAPEQRAAQTRLLQRAIPPQPAAAAAAVSRIISPRPRPEPEELDDDEDEADLEVEQTERELTGGFSFEELADLPEAAAKPASAPKNPVAVKPAPPQAAVAPAVEEAEVASEAPARETQSTPAPAADPAPKPAVKAQADLFAETVPVSAQRRARRQKTDSVVTASVLIGIGNKPYLRGSGGGLNWETGVVMDFEEIGKWGWLAPADLEAPIEFQIFCNDTDPDRKGKHRLEPGQKLEVTPVF